MNKNRRKEIYKIIERLNDLKSDLESIRDDEQDYFDNMPENLQGSIRGEESEEYIEYMEEAIEALNSSIEQLEEI